MNEKVLWSMFCIVFLVWAISTFKCTSEKNDGCTPNEIRCYGQTLELCDSESIWEPQYFCPDFGLVCCPTSDSYDCLEHCDG